MTRKIIDIEADSLNPTKIWCVVTIDVDTEEVYVWRYDDHEKLQISSDLWIGHNLIDYDVPNLNRLCPTVFVDVTTCVDTLVCSRLFNQQADGHSLGRWGERLGEEKSEFSEWNSYSDSDLEHARMDRCVKYCIQDCRVNLKLFKFLEGHIYSDQWKQSLRIEHDLAIACRRMHDDGFAFDIEGARRIHGDLSRIIEGLAGDLQQAFPPRSRLVKEICPRLTKSGALSRSDFRWIEDGDLRPYSAGAPFSRIEFIPFNPASPQQVVERLNEAGWEPFEKTKGHKRVEKELNEVKRMGRYANQSLVADLEVRLKELEKTGWTISEDNLSTLPDVTEMEEWNSNCRIKLSKAELYIKENTIKNMEKKREQPQDKTTTIIKSITETNSLKESMALVQTKLNEWHYDKETVASFVNQSHHLWLIIVTPTDTYVDCSATIATPIWDGLKRIVSLSSTILNLKACQLFVKYRLLAKRQQTLEEWFEAYDDTDGRIRGKFTHIGAWTGRMSHSAPNMGNVPSLDSKYHSPELKSLAKQYGKDMRSLWTVPSGKRLVGVDAEGIQLRVLGHYMGDQDFIEALVSGVKNENNPELSTDPHTLNAIKLGMTYRDRARAKTWIYAWLLGAGIDKSAKILGCTRSESKDRIDNFIANYPGLSLLKNETIPADADRGYFEGFDGRLVKSDEYHMLAGYLQNGETVVMRHAMRKWKNDLDKDGIEYRLVNIVHDEFQTEVPDDDDTVRHVIKTQSDAIVWAGEQFGLRCPMAGSGKSGYNWYETH